ncbi:hypothetical protein [Microbacterium sp. CFBP9034]|uniref:hypothetical protein n=1 Tax=Microbacterium sp. CFBP9034 TaxID=3096540 RepID=UPI002A698B91|nr:hypothetical protein [Microbacterium sp. CFBP9034]MDY0910897.1 hypothetical protein [Microbacterium sp. CFBP9034]
MTAGDPEAGSLTAAPDPAQTQTVFLVVTTAELKDSVAGIVESARYRLTTRPSLEGITVVGPVRPSRTVGQWLRGSEDAGESVWRALRDSIPKVTSRQGANLLLGVVVVDRQPDAVADRIAALRASPRLQALPLQIHGLSIDGQAADGSGRAAASRGVEEDEHAVGAAVRDRIDIALLRIMEGALSRAEADPDLLIPEPLLARLFAGRTMQRDLAAGVRGVTLSDTDESSAHARLIASGTRQDAEEPQLSTPAPPDVTGISHRPLRRLYIVAAAGVESRPRKVRRRLGELIENLDLSLTPSDSETTGYTWLVAAGNPQFSQPTVRPSGTLTAADLPRGSATHVDMRATMRGVAALVSGHDASFRRRGHALTPALVVFVLPSATLAGPTTLAAYRSIKELATVGWIITGSGSRSPSRDVDGATLVHDTDDAANELAAALRIAELEASDVDSVLRDLENEMQHR